MNRFYIFLMLLVAPLWAVAQSITGPTTVEANSTHSYSLYDDVVYANPNFTVANGTIVSQTHSGLNHNVTITWACPTTGTVFFNNSSSVIHSLPVTINCMAVPTPTATFTYQPGCTNETITRSNPPKNTVWFWQTTETGTATSNSTATYAATATGTYYLRTRNSVCTSCWSAAQATTPITAIGPQLPTGVPASRCGAGSITLSATPVPNASGYTIRWYSAATGGSVLHTGTSYSPSISATTTYYASTYKSTSPTCESTSRTPVVATVDPASVGGLVTSSAQTGTGPQAPQATLVLNNHVGNVVRWEYNTGSGWQTVTPNNTSTTLSFTKLTENRQYRAVVKSGQCAEAFSTPARIEINHITYGNTVILQADAASTYQWFKTGTSIGGATQQTYAITESAVYTVKLNGAANPANVFYVYPILSNQVQPVNAVSSITILKPGVTATTSLYTLDQTDMLQTISYQNGLGKTYQQIGVGLSPAGKDIVTATGFGRQGLTDTTYLPYVDDERNGLAKTDAIRGAGNVYSTSAQYQFYQGTPKVATDANPYARTVYRNTPDARPIEQGAPGQAWQPNSNPALSRTVRSQIALNNTTTYAVRQWNAAGSTTANYAANKVWLHISTDENGNQVRTFTDGRGLTILKQVQLDETQEGVATPWLETYTIYDEQGRVLYILPPKAMKVLGTGASLNANNTLVTELIHKFTYDTKGRLVEKKVPGAAVQFMVYDKHDRVVLTQDGTQRSANKWLFIKYDIYNRPVYTGIYTNTTQTTRATVQALLDNLNYTTTPWYESEGTVVHGYTNNAFPTTGTVANTILSASYYDHYDFDRNATDDFTYDTTHVNGNLEEPTRSVRTRGLPTGSKRNVLDAAGNTTAYWITSAVFYDGYDRPIQTQTNNHLYTAFTAATLDKTTVIYDFVKALKTKSSHYQNATTVVHLEDWNDYDHAGRVLKTYRKINGGATQLLAQYEYNAVGQVVDKKLHNTGGSTFLQSVDYRYNIRGWLSSINNAQLANDANVTNDETNDYFGMELLYHTTESGLNNNLYFNGNISAAKWKGPGASTGSADQRSYIYEYDKSDRLEAATFKAHTGAAWTKEANTLNEAQTYDVNGNIKTLTRNRNLRGNTGITITATPETFDNLTYTYASNLDKLTKVEDAVSIAIGTGDFKNNVNTTTEYNYNTDGSLTTDNNKGISSITYNLLGKPQVITYSGSPAKTISYTYDAAGSKLKMVTLVNGVTTTTDYVGGFVYTNNTLSFFSSPEGRVVKNGANFEYQYALADNLGNTRVVFSSVTPAPEAKTATMEAATNTDFLNYTNRVGFNLFDHTDAGTTFTYAQKLTGGNNSQIGVAKSYKVYAGDKVKIEAWAKYQNPTSTGSNINGFANALFTAFGVPAPAGGESGTISSALNIWGGLVVGGNGGSSTGPKAFVNIIVFDKDYKLLDAAWEAVDPGANQVGASPVVPHDYLMREYTAKEEGYVFMYVSNENPTLVDVYFDDIVMTHTKSNVVQYNEYYPFGMQTANSWTRENVTGNNFLGNGGTELNTTSNLYDLDFRNYDPILGRMNGVDPMATKYASLSPYNFSFNDPVTFNDPSGADPPQTINYGARSGTWYTSYTYDDRVDYDRGEWFHGGSSSAMSFHFGGRGGGIINWGNGTGTKQHGNSWVINWNATGDFGGTWNSQNGYSNFSSGEQALAFGIAYNDRHNAWGNTAYGSGAATEFAYTWAKATGSIPVRETVDYWMDTRNSIVSSLSNPNMIASTGKMIGDPDLLGFLRKSSMLALRIALHLPDAIAVAGNVNMVTGIGMDLTFGYSGYIKMLSGSDRGSASEFEEFTRALGWDLSVGVSFTELFFIPNMNVTPILSDFSGKRYSLSVGWGGYPFLPGPLAFLDLSIGLSYAESYDSSRNLRGYSIGISRFYGFGDPGPSFNLNVGSTRFKK